MQAGTRPEQFDQAQPLKPCALPRVFLARAFTGLKIRLALPALRTSGAVGGAGL